MSCVLDDWMPVSKKWLVCFGRDRKSTWQARCRVYTRRTLSLGLSIGISHVQGRGLSKMTTTRTWTLVSNLM
uniref:Uncharacterized protein n=1 Tax=Hyaloperonospora arabidopsidis (strain Emoy2) TaxID=559515 RepID=M4B9G8_HYAAE